MKKQTDIGQANVKMLVDQFRCGECLHFKDSAHPAKQDLCSNLGIKKHGSAPRCFTPNVMELTKVDAETIPKIAVLLAGMTSQQKRILQGLLAVQHRLKKTDFRFGTKIFFHVGRDYIENYLSGYVVGRTSSRELIIVGSVEAHRRGQSMVVFFENDAELLSVSEWKKKRQDLYASGKIHPPSPKRLIKKPVNDTYEPPTVDKAPEEIKKKLKRGQKSRYRVRPLTEMVRDSFSFSAGRRA